MRRRSRACEAASGREAVPEHEPRHMETEHRPPRSRTASDRWLVGVPLLLIFAALLGTWNEIRFQGCVRRQDQERLVSVTGDRPSAFPGRSITECRRLPLR